MVSTRCNQMGQKVNEASVLHLKIRPLVVRPSDFFLHPASNKAVVAFTGNSIFTHGLPALLSFLIRRKKVRLVILESQTFSTI